MKKIDKCAHNKEPVVSSIARDFNTVLSAVFGDSGINKFLEVIGLKKKNDYYLKRTADNMEKMAKLMKEGKTL